MISSWKKFLLAKNKVRMTDVNGRGRISGRKGDLQPISKPVSGYEYIFSTSQRLGTEVLSPPLKKGDLGGFQEVI
jgi:hypothetical protein